MSSLMLFLSLTVFYEASGFITGQGQVGLSMDMGSNSMNGGSGSMDMGSGSMDMGSGSMDMGSMNGGSMDMGSDSMNNGPGSMDMGSGSMDMGSGSMDMGSMNRGSMDMGSDSMNSGSGSMDMGSGSMDMGPGSMDMGPGHQPPPQGSMDMGSGSMDMGSGSMDMGSGSMDMGSGSIDMGSGSMNNGRNKAEAEVGTQKCEDDNSADAWNPSYSCKQIAGFGWCDEGRKFRQETLTRCPASCGHCGIIQSEYGTYGDDAMHDMFDYVPQNDESVGNSDVKVLGTAQIDINENEFVFRICFLSFIVALIVGVVVYQSRYSNKYCYYSDDKTPLLIEEEI